MSAGEGARIQSAAQSDVGRSRTENQDAFGEFTSAAGERLFVVADGMGGHRGGATASRLCVETLGREFAESTLSGAERLRRGLELANERVHRAALADPELSGMGTTAVALSLSPDGTATLAWVGDSRAYRFRDGTLELLSSDHSVVGEMVRSGVLSPGEAESHPRRNELLRAIGPRPDVEPETRTLEHQMGDRFLLCTDGLWGPVPEAELGAVVGYEAPDLAVRKLIAKANERGGPDNVTVQIAWLTDPLAAALSAPDSRRAEAAPRRSPSLPLLAGSAAAVVALIIALALYGLREQEPAGSGAAAVAPTAPSPQQAMPSGPPAEPPTAVAKAAPAEAAGSVAERKAADAKAAEASEAKAKAAEAKAAEAKAAEAKAAKAKAAAEAKAAEAKAAETRAAEAKAAKAKAAAEAKAAEAKAAEAKAAEAQAAASAPASVPAEPPATPPATEAAKPEVAVAQVEPAATAPAPAPVAPSAEPAPPKPAEPLAAATPQRAEVERFLSDWESAIANKNFALYSSLGLPGNEQSFRSNYVDSQAKLALALRDVQQTAPDELVVRVQMVLERTGGERIDEERKLRIRQTPGGLRYSGPAE